MIFTMSVKKKVAVGLSGGVDSAVSAYLLKKQGYDVHCIYLNCYDADTPGCRAKIDRADALKIALHLNLPFRVLDFRKEYRAAVIDYFKREYLAGRTPNPDVVCNRDIKFGLFLDWAIKSGFDYIATGHYAGALYGKSRRSAKSPLRVPKDIRKDQTYFLWQVPLEKFQHVLFPLADYLKSEVRDIARKIGLLAADKKDSTGICFIGEVRVRDFLKQLGVKEKRGEVVVKVNGAETIDNRRSKIVAGGRKSKVEKSNSSSIFHPLSSDCYRVIGFHRGVWFYTIGQRHGFEVTGWLPPSVIPASLAESRRAKAGIYSNRSRVFARDDNVIDRPPLYVISKDIKHNRLVVGFGAECYRDNFEISSCNWLVPLLRSPLPPPPAGRRGVARAELRRPLQSSGVFVRLRHGGELIPCQIERSDLKTGLERPEGRTSRSFKVFLSAAQRGLAPGQSAVFYSKSGTVLGGGIIER